MAVPHFAALNAGYDYGPLIHQSNLLLPIYRAVTALGYLGMPAVREPRVRSWIVAAGIVLMSCGPALSEGLVFEPFEKRSQLVSSRLLATNFSIRLDAFGQMAEAAKKKFGEKAKTTLHG